MNTPQTEIAELKQILSDAQERINQLESGLKTPQDPENQDFESFYLAFENKYRGSEEDIYSRLEYYRNVLHEKIPDRDSKVLDLGCGRGEWLQLLQNSGYKDCKGIDLNSRMVERCLAKDLFAERSDIFEYLKNTENNSYSAITGFHIIEHFPFKKVVSLFQEIHRSLSPGGIAIFETPNPRNVFVGACSFHFDPTHVKPIPSELSHFLAEHIGFELIALRYANTHPDIPAEVFESPALPQLWHDSFAIGLDYGLVIQKTL